MTSLGVDEVGDEAAADVLAVVRRAFGARPRLDPPSSADQDTAGTVADRLAESGGLLARHDGDPVGALLFEDAGSGRLALRRVSVDPAYQGHGVASAMVGVAEEVAAGRGCDTVELVARAELPDTVRFWHRRDYVETGRAGTLLDLAKALPVSGLLASADDTRAFGERLAGLLRAGDLVLLVGGLGAGKTTLTQGIGAGLRVRGPVTSPTFVISRVHPALDSGPQLAHADAYRLGGAAELDDLDLDASIGDAVTVVEWGTGLAERLADSWLDVRLDPGTAADTRVVSVRPHGPRWIGARLRSTLAARLSDGDDTSSTQPALRQR